eukprot:RCo039513
MGLQMTLPDLREVATVVVIFTRHLWELVSSPELWESLRRAAADACVTSLRVLSELLATVKTAVGPALDYLAHIVGILYHEACYQRAEFVLAWRRSCSFSGAYFTAMVLLSCTVVGFALGWARLWEAYCHSLPSCGTFDSEREWLGTDGQHLSLSSDGIGRKQTSSVGMLSHANHTHHHHHHIE